MVRSVFKSAVRAGLDPPAYQAQMRTVDEEGGHIGPPLQRNGKQAVLAQISAGKQAV